MVHLVNRASKVFLASLDHTEIPVFLAFPVQLVKSDDEVELERMVFAVLPVLTALRDLAELLVTLV